MEISKLPPALAKALQRPSGARFFRCALQVNPFAYVKRHRKFTSYTSEDAYNEALVDALEATGIEVIAVTDHYRVRTSESLINAARQRGIHAFVGFEAVTKEGVHTLCIFDPTVDLQRIDRFIGECGVHDDTVISPSGEKDLHELLDTCTSKWNGVCLAAHVCSAGGLLVTLKGQACTKAWRHKHLHACLLPGSIDDAPENYKLILSNRNPDYRRNHNIAVINAQDISDPADAAKKGSSCCIKMTSVNIDGLKQAILDPKSRIHLVSDDDPDDHTEVCAIAWEGGFLDGVGIHFSENLNVMIGGRGTGKSTVIESIRYALNLSPLGQEAADLHKSFANNVLGSGTKISILLRSHSPSHRVYIIERTVSNSPTVRTEDGKLTALKPTDVAGDIEVYGQHEISELAKSPERLTSLLDRFMDNESDSDVNYSKIVRQIEDTRRRIIAAENEINSIDEDLASLPGLQETLKRFKESGLEERMKDKNQLISEEAILSNLDQLLVNIVETRDDLENLLPLDTSRLSPIILQSLGGGEILLAATPVIETYEQKVREALSVLDRATLQATTGLMGVRNSWNVRRDKVDTAHEKTLRELQRDGVDGAEFTELRRKIEQLSPKKEQRTRIEQKLKDAQDHRRSVLKDWEDSRAADFRKLQSAAKRVNRKLSDTVQVTVTANGDRTVLIEHIRSLGGRVADTVNVLKSVEPLSLQDLAQGCREGKSAILERYGIPLAQADRLANAGSEFIMKLEELALPATTTIKLNVSREVGAPIWRELNDLSTGQKATAVLLLLLLDSSGPLAIDQPEDDLDNRFITEIIVPKIRSEKQSRQFIFATHNANIPVLGDAELVVALASTYAHSGSDNHLPDENIGSIDSTIVREMIEETLEGGKDAFEMRRLKYGFQD